MATTRSTGKLSPKWVCQTCTDVLKFLPATHFPPVERPCQRGETFTFPAWLIMRIAVLAVTCQEPTALTMHQMTWRCYGP